MHQMHAYGESVKIVIPVLEDNVCSLSRQSFSVINYQIDDIIVGIDSFPTGMVQY